MGLQFFEIDDQLLERLLDVGVETHDVDRRDGPVARILVVADDCFLQFIRAGLGREVRRLLRLGLEISSASR